MFILILSPVTPCSLFIQCFAPVYLVRAEIRYKKNKKNLLFVSCFQIESGQSDLGTLANVVTSLANLSDSLKENLNNGSTSDSQREEQSASDITRSEQSHKCAH